MNTSAKTERDLMAAPKVLFLNTVFLFAGIVAFGMSFIRWQTNPLMGSIDLLFACCNGALIYYLNRHREKIEAISTVALWLAYSLFTTILILAHENSTRISLFFLLAASAFFLKGRKSGLVWLLLILLTIVSVYLLEGNRIGYSQLDIVTACLYLIALYFIFRNYETFKETVSEQDRDKEILRLSEERFRTLAENGNDIIAIVTNKGVVQFISPSIQSILGHSPAAIIHTLLSELIHPFDRPGAAVALANVLDAQEEHATEHYECRMRHRDGSYRDFELISRNLMNHPVIGGIVINGRDVTARKQAEAQLYQLSQAIEQTGESILLTNRYGVIEYVNSAFTKLTGYSAEEVIGHLPAILGSGENTQPFYEEMWKTINQGRTWQGKIIDRKKNGQLFPAVLSISPIRDKHGVITHFVGSHTNLTELDKMEQQFRQAQKMEALGTLVGGIAHDFNNILAGMTGNLYLAKRATRQMPDVQQKLATVDQLSFRAADLIKQLLTFARKDMVNMQPLSLAPFINDALRLCRTSIPENITISHHTHCDESLQIEGNSTQLHQVLMNLINNARDAVEESHEPSISISLTIVAADQLHARPDIVASRYVRLSVSDNGCGIAADQQAHLFEPFYTTKEQGKGTGLGLAMVFGAVQTHHGFIEVESTPHQGATFHIFLPLLEQQTCPATQPAQQKQPAKPGHGELILLVDDERSIIDMGRDVLESLGYRVICAANGIEAVELFRARRHEVALIIMDIVMPKLGGVQAAERIRAIAPEVRVIFATGYDRETALPDALTVSDAIVLSKPYNIDQMHQLIQQQLTLSPPDTAVPQDSLSAARSNIAGPKAESAPPPA
ncbi:PAS domain S-box protein [Mariprofundus erugo]|uniref:PAS domain-containing hybrid sensor histidine kinase/response regulator n=1 Tax=Mariprofundus erugo TaxID=2528639 RepID=UPI0010FDDE3E|nr:PAS domain-containing sensor histidine kinase [Mariprofundus erugo]TLS76007.1 PAS domain S-box protein [Mariprofundus erugo]